MANWGDTFANAFLASFEGAQDRALKYKMMEQDAKQALKEQALKEAGVQLESRKLDIMANQNDLNNAMIAGYLQDKGVSLDNFPGLSKFKNPTIVPSFNNATFGHTTPLFNNISPMDKIRQSLGMGVPAMYGWRPSLNENPPVISQDTVNVKPSGLFSNLQPTLTSKGISFKQGLDVSEKEDQWLHSKFKDMGDDLDWNKNVRSAYGVTAQGFHRAERLEGLVNNYADGNIDSREMEELAIGLNAVLQGSNQSAQAQVKALVPQSARGSYQKIKEWFLNEPQGLQQQKFVTRMLNDVRREKTVMYNQLLRDAQSKISKYDYLRKKDPSRWEDIVQSWGINPKDYDEWKAGGFKPKDTTSTTQFSNFNVNGKNYRIPKDKVAEFKKDMGL